MILSYFELGPLLNLTSLINLGRGENSQGLREKGGTQAETAAKTQNKV